MTTTAALLTEARREGGCECTSYGHRLFQRMLDALEAAEARLAKVLPLAIDTIQVVRGGEWVGGKRCRSCYAEWADGYTSQGHAYNEPRTCAPDCPARPMENA